MENVGASLEECIMIGDDLSVDIIPAKEIGMTHIYFNRKKISHNEKIDYEIYDLIEKYKAEKEIIIFKSREETDEYLNELLLKIY